MANELAVRSFDGLDGYKEGKRRRKGRKGGKGGGGRGAELADGVTDMAYESVATIGVQKLYFGGKLAEIKNGAGSDVEKNVAIRQMAGKHLLGAIIARRMFKTKGLLGAATKGIQAVACVAIADTL